MNIPYEIKRIATIVDVSVMSLWDLDTAHNELLLATHGDAHKQTRTPEREYSMVEECAILGNTANGR